MLDSYEELTSSDKERFKTVLASLMGHTFILRNEYDFNNSGKTQNEEYTFIYRNFDLIDEYLSLSGYSLARDDVHGIIYLSSFPEGTRIRFDKLTTLILYALRLIYEEKKDELIIGEEVVLSVSELNLKLISLGVAKDRPLPNYVLQRSLSTLSRFRLITKKEGDWASNSTQIAIFPTILLILNQGKIEKLETLLKDSDEKGEDEV